jgi:hypothetical protein
LLDVDGTLQAASAAGSTRWRVKYKKTSPVLLPVVGFAMNCYVSSIIEKPSLSHLHPMNHT